MGALVADRRGDLHVHAGAPAQRAAEVTGPDLGLRGQAEQALVDAVEDAAGALGLLDRQIGPRHVADE